MLLQHNSIGSKGETAHTPSYKTSPRLNILSWNIYMLPWLSLMNGNPKRAGRIAGMLENSGYHVVVFQEAFSSKCRKVLSEKLESRFPFRYGPFNERFFSLRTNSGLWILSRIPLKVLGEIEFSSAKGFDAVARKGAVLLEGSFEGSDFHLLATHLQAEEHACVREKQCLEIREKLLNRFYNPAVPQFLCGDFNTDKQEAESYRKMLNLLDARDGEINGPIQVTFDEIHNTLAYKPGGKRRVLDYALVRNAELLDSMERKVNTFLTSVGELESYLSDHYAMEFSVSFAERDEMDDHGFSLA